MTWKHYVELESGLVFGVNDLTIWPGAKQLSKAEGKRRIQQEAKESLKRFVPDGATVYASILKVSKSGMSRRMRFYVVWEGRIQGITGWVGSALGWPHDGGDWVHVHGCGMDMAFHTVESLKYALGYQKLQSEIL